MPRYQLPPYFHPQRHILRRRPLIRAQVKSGWYHHASTVEESVEPHRISTPSHPGWYDLSNQTPRLLRIYPSPPHNYTRRFAPKVIRCSSYSYGIFNPPEVEAESSHTVLLNHLSIPTGVSLVQAFRFSGGEPPLADYAPKPSDRVKTLQHVTALNLFFGATSKFIRGGRLDILSYWLSDGSTSPYTMDRRILWSLDDLIFVDLGRDFVF